MNGTIHIESACCSYGAENSDSTINVDLDYTKSDSSINGLVMVAASEAYYHYLRKEVIISIS
jgi:hypothetical protein